MTRPASGGRDVYPDFQLEDELFVQVERDVMTGSPLLGVGPIVARGPALLRGLEAQFIVYLVFS